ncbi:hypothetical protein OPQ81_004490 [Rhizoctonia solani]|nr:hypothetical protein OPQ81_004490 [Rhizoctonia solani]
MPLVRCIDGEDCNRSYCRFVHPNQPQWTHASESNLAKRRRAEAAAAGQGPRDTGYGSRSKGGRDSGRASITSSTSGWGDTRDVKVSPGRLPRDPSPGWGAASSGGGWGTSNSGGWGASPKGGGWGELSSNDGWGTKSGDGGFGNTSGSGWGDTSGGWSNPEPSPRQSAPKSPARASSPRREQESNKSRHNPSSSSKEKHRDKESHRGRERDRDTDRDRKHEDNPSPPHTNRPHRRSPSSGKPSIQASDAMDIDPPNPSSMGAAPLSTSVHMDSSTPSAPATTTTARPVEATPAAEMPISIPFPRTRQADGLPPPPQGSGAPSVPRTLSAPSAQSSMPPPPPPLGTPPVVSPPPVAMSSSKPSSKSPPRSSDATTTHSLPVRPSDATDSLSPPQTNTIATPMAPHGSGKKPAIPATPATPAIPVAPVLPTPASPAPSTSIPPAAPPVERPHEWIESLESLIKQNRILQNCKQQYARAEAQEKLLLSRGFSGPKRGLGDTAPSLADMRRRIESAESGMQALLHQFAARMEIFYRPSEVFKHVDTNKDNEGTLSLAHKLSDRVSLLESETQLLQISTIKTEDIQKLEESVTGVTQAILKERGERTKVVEDVKKDVKVLSDDLNRTKIECERLREELVTSGSNFDQVRCDTHTMREQQTVIKEEVKAVKVDAEATKADVQTVKSKMSEVGKEMTDIKAEMERLKVKLKTPPPSPTPAPASHPATTSGKRARNGVVSPGLDAMEVDDVLPPAKRVRTVDPLRPSPFVDSTTPLGSPRPVRHEGPDYKELLERFDVLEDLVETLQGDILQLGTDVQDQLQEFSERLGLSDEQCGSAATITEARSESAPPSLTPKAAVARAPGRSSAPPAQTKLPASWGPTQLPTVEELPSDDAVGTLRVDLDAMMGQVVGLWNGEGDWPAHVQMNLCKALGVESLDRLFKTAPPPEPAPRIVNGKKPEPQEDWVEMFKSMKEEQARMREEMKKERMEQEARMKAMMERLERTEEALDHSIKSREKAEREYEALKARQQEQNQLLVHLQSVVDNLPKPGNGMLSPEGLLQDAVKNGTSPVQQELAALRKLATTVPALLALAGISAEKEN